MVRGVFLDFLGESTAVVGQGLSGMVLRLGLVLVGMAAIDMYGALLRSEDRDILAILPVEPVAVVLAAIGRLILRRVWVVPACGVLLVPVALEVGIWPWLLAVAGLISVQVFAWPAAACTLLLSVYVSESTRWAPILDLIRGPNPREQAAFLYAPGIVLVVSALILFASMSAVAGAISGHSSALLLLLIGPAIGVGLGLLVPRLARGAWLRAAVVTTEIDARWEALRDHDEASRGAVYLDWSVRFFPPSWRRRLRHELRHGWRGRRAWLMAAWVLGLAGAAAGWTEAATGPVRALSVAVLGVALVASVTFALERDEPPFLRWWLPDGPGPRHLLRALAVLLWVQPVVVLSAVPVGLFAGLEGFGLALLVGQTYAMALAFWAVVSARLGALGPVVYAVVALASGLLLPLGYGLEFGGPS